MHKDSPFHPKYLPTWLSLGLLRLVTLLPFSLVQFLGRQFGKLVFLLLKSRREITRTNIRLCLPELSAAEQEKLARDSMITSAAALLETAYSWWAPDKGVLGRSTVEGTELVEQAHAEGRGVILLGGHFSSMDFCGRILGQTINMDATYRAQDNAAFDYVLEKARARNYKTIIEKNEMRKMVKNLKQGHTVWYTCDQDFGRKNSVFAPFFGIQALTLATLSKLLKMTGAKVLFCTYHKQGSGSHAHFHIRIHDPFQDRLGDDDYANAVLINQTVEAAIREFPEQYMWEHRRFKKRPEGEQGFYPAKKKQRKK